MSIHKPMALRLRSRDVVEAARRPAVIAAAGVGVAFYLAYHLTKLHVGILWPPILRGDASILFDMGQRIVALSQYPSDSIFPYPPPAVLIFAGLGGAGPTVFMGIWYLLMVAALVLILRTSLLQERAAVQSAWLVLGLAAVLLADSPISWDLRNANSNLIVLGLVMAGYALLASSPILAGAVIGLSVSVKLYSGLLLIWMLLRGQRRAFAGAVVATLILWIVLPCAVFGAEGALRLYATWVQQLRGLGDPLLQARPSSALPLVSLSHAVMALTGEPYGSPAVRWRVDLLLAVWVAALAWYAWRCRPLAGHSTVPSRAALADWTVLLLAPLPASPWLEPYHSVPLLLAASIALVIALDETMSGADRLAASTMLATSVLWLVCHVPFAVRGLQVEGEFLIVVLALGYVRPRLAQPAEPPAAPALVRRGGP